jgi:hypothetical protein
VIFSVLTHDENHEKASSDDLSAKIKIWGRFFRGRFSQGRFSYGYFLPGTFFLHSV